MIICWQVPYGYYGSTAVFMVMRYHGPVTVVAYHDLDGTGTVKKKYSGSRIQGLKIQVRDCNA